MKKLLVIASLFLVGCETSTKYGDCYGALLGEPDKSLHYDISGWNVLMAFIFSETFIVPVVVIADGLFCPTGKE